MNGKILNKLTIGVQEIILIIYSKPKCLNFSDTSINLTYINVTCYNILINLIIRLKNYPINIGFCVIKRVVNRRIKCRN